MYTVYMLRCSDNSLYTGITNDFEKRFKTHINKGKDAAKYTKSRKVVSVVARWETETKSDALKLEMRIKKLKKDRKEELISSPGIFESLFGDLEGEYTFLDTKNFELK